MIHYLYQRDTFAHLQLTRIVHGFSDRDNNSGCGDTLVMPEYIRVLGLCSPIYSLADTKAVPPSM